MVKHSLIGLGAAIVLGASAAMAAELPVVKSATLGTTLNVPWSKPVQVVDPFEGTFVAVFDRNYFLSQFLEETSRVDVLSLWSRPSIRFLVASRDRDCRVGYRYNGSLGGLNCVDLTQSRTVISLFVKVGDRVVRLDGQNSTFQVTEELANSLRNAPDGNVNIRLVTDKGETIDTEIGKETVKAWKTVFTL